MLWHDREYDLPDDRFIPREHLGAARGCIYGSTLGAAGWALLFALGWVCAGIRFP